MTKLFLLTFNCAKLDQVESGFVDELHSALPKQCPDLLIFGFQELLPILEATSYGLVDVYLNNLRIKIQQTVSQFYHTSVEVVAHEHVGAIGSFVLTPHQTYVNKVSTSSASCGILYSSLKGATAIRINYKDEEFTFVTAHLAANEGNVDRRNKDYWRLMTSMEFGDGFSVLKPNSHTFFMGDLNYRAKHYGEGEEGDSLLNNDELTGVLSQGSAFIGMQEEDINFKPTYKYYRIPSWCDRILFQNYKPGDAKIVKYNSLSSSKSSDHEPVYLEIEVYNKPNKIINEDGLLILDGRDMRKSFISQFENYAHLVADFFVGSALFFTTTTNGRVVIGTSTFLLLLLHWWLILYLFLFNLI
ncbi:Inositol polyphosphate 5-phosphatase OCRL-1 [Cyberlindnera fabianii]|uniref:Inositol polyphosphate 5-phosphatase OCRL-1 n=1 Tax=Cyberlindnera fabianii TaxID=36022 RepID=A0A1V2KZR5_CYBFA|nr:Inositol polyphosphate 5-phosphatase OCRL-1 [Cyberlindnera fabianii]